jgi:hypothetical protein
VRKPHKLARIADKERKHHENNKAHMKQFLLLKRVISQSFDNQITIIILRLVATHNPITII